MATSILSAERLREVLHYDPETGAFTWKVRTSNRVSVGAVAGAMLKTGYLSICIDRKFYRAHRLAWLFVHGEWPNADIDHLNGIRTDNRFVNLRAASRSVNQQNLRAARGSTASGMLGVYRSDKKGKPWRSCIKVDGVDRHLGNYATPEDAQAAYIDAKRKLHEGCTI